ncbi:hypothetical protein RhiirC2_775305 [Rhizophagus irregularis]|uniref:Uncharacterized protein n=1 Tax=Rhizophagus irregularis TaxID=588596 RepID=A0A2N1NJH9_9GLOM|nr:hypothetical protein RhiirC2_775305 [Rhizophagus irregularis]
MEKLLELIMKHCKNIKFLDLNINVNQIIYSALNLIENIKQNLNYLSIKTYYNKELSSFLLQKLGQIIPPKLEYLDLYLCNVKACDFEVFLKKSQDTFIKKLLISNIKVNKIYIFIYLVLRLSRIFIVFIGPTIQTK